MADIPHSEKWHMDKRVPIALLVTIILQTGAMAWWAGSIDSRLSAIPSDLDARIREVEAHQRHLTITIDRTERVLERIETRLREVEVGAGK